MTKDEFCKFLQVRGSFKPYNAVKMAEDVFNGLPAHETLDFGSIVIYLCSFQINFFNLG